ncbi:MAG: TRAP transporter large permease [Polaromonas sp.]|nr:TRAP transporter large permease [Polaromonas sp.]
MSSILLGLFFVFLASGLPIFLVLGMTAIILFGVDGQPLVSIAQKIVDQFNSDTLMSVPFFVIAATFMQRGGVAGALVDFASAWTGRLRGGLGLVCVFGCTIFAAISGSSVATALAMGTILVPAMLSRNYERPFALGVVGASGTLGILIPPSLAFILYAIIAEESVPRLFLAGVVPGLIQAGIFALYVMWYARRHDYPREKALSREEFIRVNVRALPALAVPVIIAAGIYGGVVTITEAAAFAALVTLIVSATVYKGFSWRESIGVMGDAMKSGATILLIVATALVFGHWMTEAGGPARIVKFIVDNDFSAWQFLLAINGILLILGMFLEGASIMLITLPLLIPVLKPLGIDPVHFAVIIVINLELALITPPVGLNLYVLCGITKAPMSEAIKGVTPFIVLLAGLLIVATYVPELSLWLPNLVYGAR